MSATNLDSFFFDISLFDYPILDYKSIESASTSINYAHHGIKIIDIIQKKECSNMFELKAYLIDYLQTNIHVPQCSSYQEVIPLARQMHMVDRILLYYFKLVKQEANKRELRKCLLKFIIYDMVECNVVDN